MLRRTPSFHALDPATRAALLGDVATLQQALGTSPPAADPYAFALETPPGFRRRLGGTGNPPPAAPGAPAATAPAAPARRAATETLAERAGALIDEVSFPEFVAGLVHGTFDAVVDASIRQMEAFADLVSAVAKDVDEFTQENVTANQARDYLAAQHPQDLRVDVPATGGQPRLALTANEEDEPPAWLADYGLEGETLDDDLVEQRLVPAARRAVGESRLKTLATLVLLGMNRINIKDGKISARVRFRAAATDNVGVQYATGQDPQTWGARGAGATNHSTLVSTIGVNAQSETDLKAELFGQVELNFVSESLPLDRFADSARMTLLQRNARWSGPGAAATAAPPATPALPAPTAPAPPPPASAPPASASPPPPVGV